MPGHTRYIWMDLLNITSIVGVLMMHTNDAQNCYSGDLTFDFIWGCAVHSFYMWPVIVFYMLSGCNLMNYFDIRKYIHKRMTKVVFPFVFWSILFAFLKRNELSGWEYINAFLNGKILIIMWFFIPLFAIYFSIPFLRVFVLNSNRTKIELFLVLSFLFCSVIPFLNKLFPIEVNTQMFPMACNFLWYAVLGYYLGHFDFPIHKRRIIYFIGSVSLIIHFTGFVLLNYISGTSNTIFMNSTVPTSVCMGVAIFIWFRYKNWSCFENHSKLIAYISSCTFGIYLIHVPIKIALLAYAPILISNIWGVAPLYIVSLLTVVLIKKIPLVKNVVP